MEGVHHSQDQISRYPRDYVQRTPERAGPPVATDNTYGISLGAIQGVRFEVDSVRAKFKFGGNRSPEHQIAINSALLERGHGLDDEAASIQRDRLNSATGTADR